MLTVIRTMIVAKFVKYQTKMNGLHDIPGGLTYRSRWEIIAGLRFLGRRTATLT